MVPEAQRLRVAFVAAMPAYVTAVCAERGYPLDRATIEAIDEATAAIDAELEVELDQDFRAQRRSPLEIVRVALASVSRSLSDRGVAARDPSGRGSEEDPFGLAPGSSSDLGAEAHEAHLRWGVAKAAAFVGDAAPTLTKPAVVVMASDRAERESLVASIEGRGMSCVAVRNPGAVEASLSDRAVMVAIVDLAHRSARDAIDRFVEHGVTTIAYGDAIEDLLETGLRAQGVRHIVDRHRLLADPSGFIPLIV
jgi:hypothetical protein